MNMTKEEIGARSGALVFVLAALIGLLRGVSMGTAAMRGLICALPVLLFLGEFLGGIWLKAVSKSKPE